MPTSSLPTRLHPSLSIHCSSFQGLARPLESTVSRRKGNVSWDGVSEHLRGTGTCSPLTSQPGFSSRMLRSPGWGWGQAPPVLPKAAPSAQKETACVCLACPAWAHPCLLRSMTSGTLRTLRTSHPSACLQIRLTKCNSQAGKSLLGPPLSSH